VERYSSTLGLDGVSKGGIMSIALYQVGSDQLLEFTLECNLKSYVLDPDDWTITVTLVEINDFYVDETATWGTATIVADDGSYYGQILLSNLMDPLLVGQYHLWVRAEPTGVQLERPLFKAFGLVKITEEMLAPPEEPAP
jgi:hypothetical protein